MRNILFCAAVAIILLSSCRANEHLPVEEVMRRAAVANMERSRARFEVEGTYVLDIDDLESVSGTTRLNGFYLNGGEEIKGNAAIEAKLTAENGMPLDVDGEGEFIFIRSSDPFVRVTKLRSRPVHPFTEPVIVGALLNRWWRLPLDEPRGRGPGTSVDAGVQSLQSDMIRVLSDGGFDSINGRRAYHYYVSIDSGELKTLLKSVGSDAGNEEGAASVMGLLADVEARGEIWIDAETFEILRVRWTFSPLKVSDGAELAASFSVTFSESREDSIGIPENALPLSLENIAGSGSPVARQSGKSSLDKLIEEIIGM